jgi:N-acyl-phosphatidylethanolamine-hydrolysing phospholipase D
MTFHFRNAQRGVIAALFIAASHAGCARAADPPAQADKPHHRESGFQNNDIEFVPRSGWDLLRWQWHAARQGLPKPALTPTPVATPDLAFLRANAQAGDAMQPSVTWIGHATVLVQQAGLNLLTDPQFSPRASPVAWLGPQRAQPPGIALAELPHIDVVVVSHNHYDHCDLPSLRALQAQPGGPPLVVVPLGVKALLADAGIGPVVELDWWQAHRVRGLEVVLTPVQHWSGRGLGDRLQSLWGGYALLSTDAHVFFAGDTAYSKDFAAIRQHFADRQGDGGFDMALIPIGAYEPRWFMKDQHVDPEEAVRIHLDLGARRSLGVHWGTFELSDEALDEPPRALARARRKLNVPDTAFFVLAIGQTRHLARRGEAQ